MLPSLEYIKTVINGLKKHADNKTESVRKDLENKVDSLPQPDWNQNDSAAKDYVKNRICYVKDPILIGKAEFVAISETKMTRTMTDDLDLMRGIVRLSGEGDILKIEVGERTFMSSVYYGYNRIGINGEIYGGGYYDNGQEWTLTIDTGSANLVAGQSYEVTFINTIEDIVTIPVKYFSEEIFRHGNSPVDFGDGEKSTVQGSSTTASGDGSHAEGYYTTASGNGSHAEGYYTTASGGYSHAEGYYTTASGGYSHVEGTYNIPDDANYSYSVISPNGMFARTNVTTYLCAPSYSIDLDKGEFILAPESETFTPTESAKDIYVLDSAAPDVLYFISGFNSKLVNGIKYDGYSVHLYETGVLHGGDARCKYVEIIGNGLGDNHPSNARTLDWSGNAWFAGDVYVGSTSGTNKDDGSKKLATEAYVNENITQSIPKIESLDKTNVKILRDLEDGTYVLQGYFKPYTGANSSFIFDPPALVSISSTGSETHVQIFEAHNNQIQHLVITDTSCETTYVFLNKIGNLSALKTTAKDTLVNAINETASAIPAVTSSDNGKFLQVVDGAWTAADGNSSSDVSLGITEAYKGYGIRVKAIDENNRPTEWDAVDEEPIPLHMSNSDGTIIRFCAVPVETLTPTSAYELAKSCLKSANAKLWYPEGPLNALISGKPAALVLTVSEDDTNIYAWYISKDGTVKSVVTPKSIFTATE